MITLLIDTSSSDVSIAILRDNVILSSVIECIPFKHSVYTVSFIDSVLKKAKLTPHDVDKIMVVTGPGSFTGLRIGVTIAKVYAYLENINIIPISSLKMRSISCDHDYCLSIIDAHHKHFYIGLYDKDNIDVVEEHYGDEEEVLDIINKYHPVIVSDMDGEVGDYSYKKQELDIEKIVSYYQSAKSFNPHLVNPNYLKKPQALEEAHD